MRTMTDNLAFDRDFFRFEVAYMLYGGGWMICFMLLPIMCMEKLQMTYSEYSFSAQVVVSVVIMLAIVPMGLFIDRVGPVRAVGLAFGLLVFYPLLLMVVRGPASLALVSVLYGVGMSCVNITWTVGPVMLARRAGDASQYLAVHGSLAGVRGLVFQLLGWVLLRVTGSYWAPLVVSVLMFSAGSVTALSLARDLQRRGRIAPQPVSNSIEPRRVKQG